MATALKHATGPLRFERLAGAAAALRLPHGWTRRLLIVVVALSGISFATQVVRHGLGADPAGLNSLERWFFVDREMGIPAWFSAVLLFTIGERLWKLGTADRALGGRWFRQWRLLSVIFVYMSVDEFTEIHEQTIRPIKTLLHLSGALSFAWVVVAVPLLLLLGGLLVPFLRALPRSIRDAFLLCAVCYVGGAVGMEMVGAVLFESQGVQVVTTTVTGDATTVTESTTVGGVLYATVAGVEEGLEMFALVLFLGAATTTLRRLPGPRRVSKEPAGATSR